MLRHALAGAASTLAIGAAIVCTTAPVALACWRYTNGASNGVENPPGGCQGNCNAYYACDNNDSCVSWRLEGFRSCVCTTHSIPCRLVTGGFYDSATGCCVGGTFTPIGLYDPNAPVVVRTKCTPAGYGCGFDL